MKNSKLWFALIACLALVLAITVFNVDLIFILYIVLALVVLMVMITVHELGHYLAGKLLKFKINEFSIGMGKSIYSRVNKKTGEKFSIRLIPLGGYCAFDGDDAAGGEAASRKDAEQRAQLQAGTATTTKIADDNVPKLYKFNEAPGWRRLVVLAAGGIFNIIFGFLTVIFMLMIVGYGAQTIKKSDQITTANVGVLEQGDVIYKVDGNRLSLFANMDGFIDGKVEGDSIVLSVKKEGEKKATTVRAGFINFEDSTVIGLDIKAYTQDAQVGDMLELNVKRGKSKAIDVQTQIIEHDLNAGKTGKDPEIIKIAAITDWSDAKYSQYFGRTTGDTVELSIKRNGKPMTVTVTLSQETLKVTNLESTTTSEEEHVIFALTRTHHYGFFEAMGASVRVTFDIFWETLVAIFKLFTGGYKLTDVSGPFGTIGAMATYSKIDPTIMFMLIPLITINLGLFNLLPLPALDGGRMVFVGIEMARRKRVNPKIEEWVHGVGIILLLGFVIILDVVKMFMKWF